MYSISYFFGILFGHFTGGILYRNYDGAGPFYFSIATTIVFLPFIYLFLPAQVDKRTEYEDKSSNRSFFKDSFILFTKPQTCFPLLIIILNCSNLAFLEPILALWLKDHFKLSLFWNNNILFGQSLGFLVSNCLFLLFMRKERNITQIAFYALVLQGLAISISGPAIFLPDSLYFLVLGNVLIGIVGAPLTAVELPLLRKRIKDSFCQEE